MFCGGGGGLKMGMVCIFVKMLTIMDGPLANMAVSISLIKIMVIDKKKNNMHLILIVVQLHDNNENITAPLSNLHEVWSTWSGWIERS